MPTTGPGHQIIGIGGVGGGSTTPSPIGTATCVGVGLSIGASVNGLPNKTSSTNNINNHHMNHQQMHHHQQSPAPPPIPPHHYQTQQQQQQQPQQHTNNYPPMSHHQFMNLHSQAQTGLPYHHPSPPSPSFIVASKSPTMMHKQQQQQPPPQYQNNNIQYQAGVVAHLQYHQSSPMTPNLDNNRRTLDRSQRNLSHHNNYEPISEGILPTRIPSLRRTRRSPSHNNNINNNNNNINNNGGIPGSPRIPRSPITVRAQPAVVKRSRMGSHNENMSSGSLNSIEV